jgi:protein disulfide-isomerase A1
MDATENDLPASVPFHIQGFPTIKFKPAGSREFITYEGDRSLENLISFVEGNAKNDVTLPPPGKAVEDDEEPAATEKHDEL